jgi:hypothetical protein
MFIRVEMMIKSIIILIGCNYWNLIRKRIINFIFLFITQQKLLIKLLKNKKIILNLSESLV